MPISEEARAKGNAIKGYLEGLKSMKTRGGDPLNAALNAEIDNIKKFIDERLKDFEQGNVKNKKGLEEFTRRFTKMSRDLENNFNEFFKPFGPKTGNVKNKIDDLNREYANFNQLVLPEVNKLEEEQNKKDAVEKERQDKFNREMKDVKGDVEILEKERKRLVAELNALKTENTNLENKLANNENTIATKIQEFNDKVTELKTGKILERGSPKTTGGVLSGAVQLKKVTPDVKEKKETKDVKEESPMQRELKERMKQRQDALAGKGVTTTAKPKEATQQQSGARVETPEDKIRAEQDKKNEAIVSIMQLKADIAQIRQVVEKRNSDLKAQGAIISRIDERIKAINAKYQQYEEEKSAAEQKATTAAAEPNTSQASSEGVPPPPDESEIPMPPDIDFDAPKLQGEPKKFAGRPKVINYTTITEPAKAESKDKVPETKADTKAKKPTLLEQMKERNLAIQREKDLAEIAGILDSGGFEEEETELSSAIKNKFKNKSFDTLSEDEKNVLIDILQVQRAQQDKKDQDARNEEEQLRQQQRQAAELRQKEERDKENRLRQEQENAKVRQLLEGARMPPANANVVEVKETKAETRSNVEGAVADIERINLDSLTNEAIQRAKQEISGQKPAEEPKPAEQQQAVPDAARAEQEAKDRAAQEAKEKERKDKDAEDQAKQAAAKTQEEQTRRAEQDRRAAAEAQAKEEQERKQKQEAEAKQREAEAEAKAKEEADNNAKAEAARARDLAAAQAAQAQEAARKAQEAEAEAKEAADEKSKQDADEKAARALEQARAAQTEADAKRSAATATPGAPATSSTSPASGATDEEEIDEEGKAENERVRNRAASPTDQKENKAAAAEMGRAGEEPPAAAAATATGPFGAGGAATATAAGTSETDRKETKETKADSGEPATAAASSTAAPSDTRAGATATASTETKTESEVETKTPIETKVESKTSTPTETTGTITPPVTPSVATSETKTDVKRTGDTASSTAAGTGIPASPMGGAEASAATGSTTTATSTALGAGASASTLVSTVSDEATSGPERKHDEEKAKEEQKENEEAKAKSEGDRKRATTYAAASTPPGSTSTSASASASGTAASTGSTEDTISARARAEWLAQKIPSLKVFNEFYDSINLADISPENGGVLTRFRTKMTELQAALEQHYLTRKDEDLPKELSEKLSNVGAEFNSIKQLILHEKRISEVKKIIEEAVGLKDWQRIIAEAKRRDPSVAENAGKLEQEINKWLEDQANLSVNSSDAENKKAYEDVRNRNQEFFNKDYPSSWANQLSKLATPSVTATASSATSTTASPSTEPPSGATLDKTPDGRTPQDVQKIIADAVGLGDWKQIIEDGIRFGILNMHRVRRLETPISEWLKTQQTDSMGYNAQQITDHYKGFKDDETIKFWCTQLSQIKERIEAIRAMTAGGAGPTTDRAAPSASASTGRPPDLKDRKAAAAAAAAAREAGVGTLHHRAAVASAHSRLGATSTGGVTDELLKNSFVAIQYQINADRRKEPLYANASFEGDPKWDDFTVKNGADKIQRKVMPGGDAQNRTIKASISGNATNESMDLFCHMHKDFPLKMKPCNNPEKAVRVLEAAKRTGAKITLDDKDIDAIMNRGTEELKKRYAAVTAAGPEPTTPRMSI